VLTVVSEEISSSNRRLVLRLPDASLIESVVYRGDTLCVSTQVGCAVRCPFCASGANGLGRSLSLEEMIAQVELVPGVMGVTMSGIGEPLHNPACEGFLDWARSRRLRVTLTTSGGTTSRLRAWLTAAHHGLTISIHAGTEAVRARAVPNGPSLHEIFSTLREVVPTLTRTRRKKTALAYLVVDGLNDSDDEVDAFIERALPIGIFVHLYGYNPVPTSEHRPSTRFSDIHARMQRAGLVVRRSSQARLESNGGCGTLVALKKQKPAKTGTMPAEGCQRSSSPER
jgi:23S rRNA (adenine2503-C2)-methyltransferase